MSTTYRVYRSGTLVTTFVDADDAGYSVSPDTTGWTPGTYPITITGQLAGWAESDPVACGNETVNAAATGIALDAMAHPGGAMLVTTSSTDVSSITSPTFSTGGSTLLVACIALTGTGRTISSVTGGGLTWTQRVFYANKAAIYTAAAPSALSGASVTANFSTGRTQAMSVYALTGATVAASPVTAGAASTPVIAITLTPSTANSWTFAVASVGVATIAATPRSDTTRDSFTSEALHDNAFVFCRANTPYSGTGAITVGLTDSQSANLCALEVVPA